VHKYEQTISGKFPRNTKTNVTKRAHLKKSRHKNKKGSRMYFLSYMQRYISIAFIVTCLMYVVQSILKIGR